MTATPVFTVRHRKALVEVITAALTHTQLDALTAEHPVPGDPGHDAGKEGRVELLVLTYLEEDDHGPLIHALALIDPASLTDQVRKSWDMLGRRLRTKGLNLPTPASADSAAAATDAARGDAGATAEGEGESGAVAADPGQKPAPKKRGARGPKKAADAGQPGSRKATVAAPQLVTVGGTAELVAQLEALEGVEVVHVEDGGTRGQALAVLAAVSAALQTPGAVVAIGGPAEMMARLSVRG